MGVACLGAAEDGGYTPLGGRHEGKWETCEMRDREGIGSSRTNTKQRKATQRRASEHKRLSDERFPGQELWFVFWWWRVTRPGDLGGNLARDGLRWPGNIQYLYGGRDIPRASEISNSPKNRPSQPRKMRKAESSK